MCGFFGVVSFKEDVNESNEFLQYALADLSRRGPDQSSIWRDDNTVLGFRRLSIQDLSDAGSQPMVSHSGNLVMVFNGEIYNVPELLSWASIDTNQLKGHSDTEVLLLCFEKKGIQDTLERLDGIFAIGVYDIEKKCLTLARDHAGIKPLYFGYSERGIVFSSHYHLVTAHSYFSKNDIQQPVIYNYFRYGFIQEGEGLLADTYNMPHGHFISLSKGSGISWKPYFNPRELFQKQDIPANTQQLHTLYKGVVQSQLVSDVPVGTFLSGGVDSTITSALVRENKADIVAFTIGVDDPELDETEEAQRFAGYFKLKHIVRKVDEKSLSALMDEYDQSMAEPLSDYSSLMTLKVSELAKEQFTVALSGDGGDELFWGYPRFKEAAKYVAFFNSSKMKRIWDFILGRIAGKKIPFQLFKYKNFKEYYLSKQGIPGAEYWTSLLMPQSNKSGKPYLAKLIDCDVSTVNSAMLYARSLEYHIHLQRVLLKVDRAGMYHSLEVRTPVLSRDMVTLSRRYQYSDCVDDTKAKLPLRRLLSSLLPIGAADSGRKKGFSPPLAEWLRGNLKERFEKRLFNVPEIFSSIIEVNIIRRIWNEHQSGSKDWAWMIWSIYSLFTWTEQKMFRTVI